MSKTHREALRLLPACSVVRHALALVLLPFVITVPALSWAEDLDGVRPLLTQEQVQSTLSKDAQWLDDAQSIESFLNDVDRSPPSWNELYGDDGAGHDERLFALNRERDRLREQRGEFTHRLTFLWAGELSSYDAERGGFHVAIGPKLIPTRWGIVRFKSEELPSNLVALPPPTLKESLHKRAGLGERIDIDVAITGRLIPEESIIYDFAHDEPGRGMVMPVVRIERIDYILKQE